MDLRTQLQSALGTAYTIEREMGGGGMSRVFLAQETALGRKVVVKVLPPDLGAGVNAQRFDREVQLAARLQQAQIVPVLSAGEMDGIPYYVMPFVEGESLRARLARDGKLPITEVVSIVRDVARALAYAHERGVVHRDIKPDNVLLSGGSAVVTDFGIAKAITAARASAQETGVTQLGTSVGTPAYMSPEQAAGDPSVDHRADIYSLGCMAYELLAGAPPFAGRTVQRTLAAHLTETPRPVSELRSDTPPALAALVMQSLAKEPADRPQSAGAVLAALDAASSGSMASLQPSLLSGPGALGRALALFAVGFLAVALVAKAAVIAAGIPDWVFPAAVWLMVLALPVVAGTAYVRHVAQRAATARVPSGPGGAARPQGTIATLALRAAPVWTWGRTFRGIGWAVGALVLAVVAVMILREFGVGPAGSLLAAGKMHERERLLVIDFDAGTDSSLSHVVTEAVRTNLGQSRVVSIMPPTAIAAALERMRRPPTAIVDLGLAREIAQREGVKAIVSGAVTPVGSGYLVGINLVAADSGNTLASVQAAVDGPSQLLGAIDKLTRRLRGRIGESLKTVRDAPALEQVTTASVEALKKYAEAVRAADLEGDQIRAATLLREAVSLDTTFAMAYRKLGVALSNTGAPREQVDSALARAYRYRDHLTERERYLVVATYFDSGPGRDRAKAADAYRQVLAFDSTDMAATNNLANILRMRRQYAPAESLMRRNLAEHPVSALTTAGNLVGLLVDEGKIAAAESAAAELARRLPNNQATAVNFNVAVFDATFLYLGGRIDSAEAVLRALQRSTDPMAHAVATGNLASFALLHGRTREARALGGEAKAAAARLGIPMDPLDDSINVATARSWFLSDYAGAARTLDDGLAAHPLSRLPGSRRPYLQLAQAYAIAHRPDRARAMLATYDAIVRDATIRTVDLPKRHAAMAEILIAEGRPRDAVAEFWKSDSLPDGPAGECGGCIFSDIGRAYDLAGVPDSAIAYWERYLATPFVGRWEEDMLVLAGIHKRLGELYDERGDRARAAAHYEAFVQLWGNADPELQPLVRDVRARLARMGDVEKR